MSQGSRDRYPVWQHTFVFPFAFSRRSVGSYWQKYVQEVLVNRLGGLSLLRKSVVRFTDRPDMTLDVYRGRKKINTTTTTISSQTIKLFRFIEHCNNIKLVAGSRILVPGSWFPVTGSWFPVPGFRFSVPGSRFPIPGSWSQVPGSVSPLPDSRLPVPGSRFPGFRFSVSFKFMLLQYIPSRIHYLQAK